MPKTERERDTIPAPAIDALTDEALEVRFPSGTILVAAPADDSTTLRFPGGATVIARVSPETALRNAKEWIALAQESSDLVYIASALNRAAAALELL